MAEKGRGFFKKKIQVIRRSVMEKYQQEERKLCFMDCIWNMFFKWRVLILAVVFFAVLFGVLKYAKDYKEQEETENNKSS